MRDQLFSGEYFSKWIEFAQSTNIDKVKAVILDLPLPDRRAARTSDLCTGATKITIMRYGRGDPIGKMAGTTQQMVDMLTLKREVLASVVLEPKVRHMWERLDLSTLYLSLIHI